MNTSVTSLVFIRIWYGAFTVIAYDVGKVVDCEVLSKFRQKRSYLAGKKQMWKITGEEYDLKRAEHSCSVNTAVPVPAMESEAAKTL